MQDYLLQKSFLPAAVLQQIRSYVKHLLSEAEFAEAGIGSKQDRQINQGIRGDWVYWLDREKDQALAAFFEIMDEWIAHLNRYCYLGISGSEFHLAHYPAGSFYHRHLDQFRSKGNRLISFVLYLNEAWEPADGGQLMLYLDPEIEIQPIGNHAILFKSANVEHEVLPTHKSRYSLTGWLLAKPAGLDFL